VNDRSLVRPTIRWRDHEGRQRVELSRSPTTQQLGLLANPKLLRTASRSRLRLQKPPGGCHFAYMAITAALVYRTVAGQGQYIDASIHEACALTTEAAIANYIYRGEVLRRQTGRHHAAGPTPPTQFCAKDGTYVTALVAGRLNPRYVRELADLLDSYGMAGDLKEPQYQDPAVIAANTSHIIVDLVASFIASLPAEEVYHAAQGAMGRSW
jgi:crotonobetainyl-CoA:carnitine CoA-transferase CaiB-like acyl-CoA transferase